MNTSMLKGNWTEIKGKIKTQWAKLNDDHIEELQGNLNQLAGKIQQVYGYGKDQAEKEFNEFKNTIVSSINTATTTTLEQVSGLIDGSTDKKEPEKKEIVETKSQ
jgi:uncharacterized protein YjbJ (UPF0337 family)